MRWAVCRVLVAAVCAGMLCGVASAARAPATSSPAKTGSQLATRPVSFTTDEGIEIHGTYVPPRGQAEGKAPIVILLHMYNRDHKDLLPLLPFLHEAGFAALAIDMRGHGRSVGPAAMNLPKRVGDRDPKLFREMYRDVEAAYLWLADQPGVDTGRFVLVGASVGGSVAMNYAGRDRSVDAVVWLTPGTKYLGIDSMRDARKYGHRPLLMLAAEPERSAAETLGAMAAGSSVQLFPGQADNEMALHGTHMLGQVAGIEKTIVGFLIRSVGQPATQPVVASITSDVYHNPDSASVKRIKKANLRRFSSPSEAESRGLRPSKSGRRSSAP